MGENMIALKIEDMKQFTASLFLGEVFDSFLLKEAEIVTFNMFTIDGRANLKEFCNCSEPSKIS